MAARTDLWPITNLLCSVCVNGPAAGGGILLAILEALSILLALAAVLCILVAVAMMVRGDDDVRRGYGLRAGAVVCFGLAVLLNVLR